MSMHKINSKSKLILKILLFLGILLLLIPIISGIYYSIFGYSGLCIVSCKKYYGFEAFIDSIIVYSYILWPSYIIGLILIIVSLVLLKQKN